MLIYFLEYLFMKIYISFHIYSLWKLYKFRINWNLNFCITKRFIVFKSFSLNVHTEYKCKQTHWPRFDAMFLQTSFFWFVFTLWIKSQLQVDKFFNKSRPKGCKITLANSVTKTRLLGSVIKTLIENLSLQ